MANKCPKCHSENPNTSRFCADCGTQLGPAKETPHLTKTLKKPAPTINPGTVFSGRYEIIEKIGEGGMGEVYRSLDKNLGRSVAIKILPDAFSEDKERLARFEREAKLLAVLNHPNIAAIHGLEETEGRRFLVLEMAEGETLKTRLNRSRLDLDEALKLCHQIAEGLEAAHEKGIIHRDLKPGNIMVTSDGKVKILDFGLAKTYLAESSAIDIATSPTITAEMTQPGVILGTAAYMSPEQAKGRAADKRSDIWAFGCILYECLTGRRAFDGETISEILASVLKGEPEWKALPVSLPCKIAELLRRCLQKNPHDRLHDIGDARIEIEEIANYPTRSAETTPAPLWRKLIPWIITGAVGIGAIWIWIHSLSRTPQRTIRSTINLSSTQRLTGGEPYEDAEGGFSRPGRRAIAFSPDGDSVVYSARSENTNRLFLRPLDQAEAKPISGTEGGVMPFFSPDGRWIGFFADGKLKKVAISGGPPITLCEAYPKGGSWGTNKFIVFGKGAAPELWKIRQEGGAPEALTVLEKDEMSHGLPEVLPNGKAVLFTSGSRSSELYGDLNIIAQSVRTGKRRVVVEDGADPRFLPTGHLVFARKGTLMAVPFDPDSLELRGTPVPVLENVMQALYSTWVGQCAASAQFAVSSSGILAFVPGGVYPELEQAFVWVDFKGGVETLPIPKHSYWSTRISPDGRRIASCSYYKDRQIWVFDIERGGARKLTSEGIANVLCWGPDGNSITYNWRLAEPSNIYVKPSDGSGEAKALLKSGESGAPVFWSADGELLAFVRQGDLWVYHAADGRTEQLTKTPYYEYWPTSSPDGHWLAYGSNESGRSEIYVQAFPHPGAKYMISNDGGIEPAWAPDGRQLYYRSGDKMMVVDFLAEPRPVPGKPRVLFEGRYQFDYPIRSYDIHPDGNRFLMRARTEQALQPVTQIQIVQNWFEELKRLVPIGKR